MKTDLPKTIFLKDYAPYPFDIEDVRLGFQIYDGYTVVTSVLRVKRTEVQAAEMFLYGEALEILTLKVDGQDYAAYRRDEASLTLDVPGDVFTLEIVTKIFPEENTRLEGLYNSGGTYCTQCEAEGFRRITYFPDRPDVMSVFTVRVEAGTSLPVLLSNGNLVEKGAVEGGRHYAVWHDPFLKPCYLFALVAGDLRDIHDTFVTASGRTVDLYIYVRPGDEGQCAHAMESLKKSMKWDEDVYGLEYDLDIFNIVAVSDFNMGAMENKSLNIFNTALVLAQQETATDSDFIRVESVIAHEYFHNWSGNRVTCRDWFQLSLKEGLTVFRDQEFSADMHSRAVQRIDDVMHLRRFQFPEDAGPLAHPIRPDNYIEINNFYTMTVYEKGAEVIRMLRTILGPENYRKGTDLYFSRHDGQAVTCDDFVQAMQDASGIDLSHFKLWYRQAGTPTLSFKGAYDAAGKTYKVELAQEVPATPGQTHKEPMYIPVRVGLLNDNGDEVAEEVLHLTEATQVFEIKDVASEPTPSVLRGFSAPVKLKADFSDEDLQFLMVHDTDGFNRWEAGQRYFLNTIGYMMQSGAGVPECFLKTYGGLLDKALEADADKALMARAITLPDISAIAMEQAVIDPQAIWETREALLGAVVDHFADKLGDLYARNRSGTDFSITAEAVGKRSLCNTAMMLLSSRRTAEDGARALAHYEDANNMTDRMAALMLACAMGGSVHDEVLNGFYARFRSYPLVIDKWFSAQAQVPLAKTIDVVKELRGHPDFNIRNPNRVRSLYSAFAMMNPVRFHAADGSGYAFLRDAVVELNTINPQIAARLLTPLREWRRYTPDRQDKMKDALEQILKTSDIAPDIFEIASKSLGA
ncbi:MAG: aminopeptidase N [Alphaproteobacteria bacterium]|nr:aminopeptidase N [Alphaproteobacteria bacterium]